MIVQRIVFLLLFTFQGLAATHAQQDDFCDALAAIMRDAPNKFRNIKGRELNSGMSAVIWSCGIAVPGTVNARFVSAMGLFYEGALLQTKNKEAIKTVYDTYSGFLDNCLTPQGYKKSFQENFYPGLKEYKKVVFMPTVTDTMGFRQLPPHLALEATYSKEAGYYTVVMYIFEH